MAQGLRSVAGVDEAGRGPLAGPVVAAAVVLDPGDPIEGLADSKRLTPGRREALFGEILSRARAVAASAAGPREIERRNILQASLWAMARAAGRLAPRPDHLLVDGNRPLPLALPQTPVVSGDALCACVAAASIVAKVLRDRLMVRLDRDFPAYGFVRHKGYPTREHLAALRARGPCRLHRRTFRGVPDLLGE
ncbi:MAG: ribonuclease HII [Candidatus Tectomicrobia bacterium]|nr:ribonuclease HII [Candidatus Tectomicrobia bacterium]